MNHRKLTGTSLDNVPYVSLSHKQTLSGAGFHSNQTVILEEITPVINNSAI